MQRTVSHSTKEKTLQRKEPHETVEADQRSAAGNLDLTFFFDCPSQLCQATCQESSTEGFRD